MLSSRLLSLLAILVAFLLTLTPVFAADFTTPPAPPPIHSAPVPTGPVTPLSISTSSMPAGVAGTAYTVFLRASGGAAPYSWGISSGSLPAGLTLSAQAGIVSGVPTGAGTSTFVVKVTDKANPAHTATRSFSIAMTGHLTITSSSPLAAATSGTVYSTQLTAAGGTPGYSWFVQSGILPPGLSLASTGIVSGTPTTAGTYIFIVTVKDSGTPLQVQIATETIVVAPVVNPGTTWYVRPDGGTRYSALMTGGQCDGKSDVAYSGSGTNQHCAFKDVRYLWQDGSYTVNNTQAAFPAYGWIGSGGDTYIIRGSIGSGVSYRVGWNNANGAYDPATNQFWGVQGDRYDSGAPPPLSGTASQRTRILGENYASCSGQSARTQLHGGWDLTTVLNMSGASYVDVACLDITDFSACGKATQVKQCTNEDDATYGIAWSNTATNDTLNNIRIHGLANSGMIGPTGNGDVFTHLDILGNASSGWNADLSDGTTGNGTLLVQNFSIIGNGCAEEYPIVDTMPYGDCTDQNGGGYGDGFGTATSVSHPGWAATFDQGEVAYNTQDGLDSLHLIGSGSSMTITRVLAYGNMGQQIKVGGASGTAVNNQIVGNCDAMRQAIPGFPIGYNAHLSLFCRADNNAVFLSTSKGASTRFASNTLIANGSIGVGIACDQYNGPCDHTALVDYRDNIFIGYANTPTTGGDPSGDGSNPTPIYQCINDGDCSPQQSLNFDVFSNPGSFYANNVTIGGRNGWPCPAQYETNAICSDPGLVDETLHYYGYGNMTPATNHSAVVGAGVSISSVLLDYTGTTRPTPPSIGALEFVATAVPALTIATSSLPSATVGANYSTTLQASGGVAPYSWAVTGGSLPAGLTLGSITGAITGMPATAGTASFTVTVTDHQTPAHTQSAALSIAVAPAPVVNPGTTWYVRPDGGTRYSSRMLLGQCDGKGDNAYSGSGVNQHCAFKDVRYLWQDGSYTTDGSQASFPAYGWIGAGGDTYIIRGSIGIGVSYRVGWNNNSSSYDTTTSQFWGVQGDPYGSGAPPPLSGTAAQHTRILGENYANCSAQSARAQLHGGWDVLDVLNMSGASYVDLQCLDITDFSSCGKAGQLKSCAGQDDATNAIQWSNTSTHDTLTNIRVHGMASSGMIGPTGDGVVFSYLDIVGNASSGWNADAGDGKTGTGSALIQNYSLIGNGCAEQYPIVDAMPYGDCTDQDTEGGGGYGDAFGTATVTASPGWAVQFDQGVVAYNTQDGLDALHLIGNGSSMTITRTLAYGNMGQQIKVGGSSGTAVNNLIVGNCNAMRQAIPGFPIGYNARLSLFCRAGNSAVLLSTSKGASSRFAFNTVITNGNVGLLVECDRYNGNCDRTSLVDYRNNIFLGYPDSPSTGDASGDGDNPTPIYQCITSGDCSAETALNFDVFSNPGSFFANNVTLGARNNWSCPAAYETNAICGSPGLVDETWHLYGYGNMAPASLSSPVMGAGVAIPGTTLDYSGRTRASPPTIGAYDAP